MSKHLFARTLLPALTALCLYWGPGAVGAEAPATAWTDPHTGMGVRVLADGLPHVDNLAVAEDGVLYATLEAPAPDGRVVRIMQTDAGVHIETVLDGLDRADGLLLAGSRPYITEEVRKGRVIQLDLTSGKPASLATLAHPEGIDRLPDGSLAVSEDTHHGRVVKISPDGTVIPLATGLNRPEGLAVDGAGHLFVAETATGRILKIADGEVVVAFSGLAEPDQVEFGPYGALWITEDQTPGRLLKGFLGRLVPVLEGLSAPQGMAFSPVHGECGPTIYIAEQGKGRILAAENPCAPSGADGGHVNPENPAAP